MFSGPNPKIMGASVYALNRTYGLAPSQPYGELETVTEVIDGYRGIIRTDKGNVYSNGDFGIRNLVASSGSRDD